MDINVTSRITPEMLYAFYKYQLFRGERKKPVLWGVLSLLIVIASVVFFLLWGFDPMMLAALIVSVLMLLTVLYLCFLSPSLKYRKAKRKDKTVPTRASYHFMRFGFTASVEYGDGETREVRCDYLSLWFVAELGDSLCLCFSPDDALMLRKEAMTSDELETLEDAIIAARNREEAGKTE